MSQSIPLVLALGIPTLLLAFVLRSWLLREPGLLYPPGPKQKFLVGNLFDMPRSRPCLKYSEWSRQYGPIIYLNVAGKPIVVLNTYEVAKALLDKRGQIYSDRPQMQMAGELIGFSHNTTLTPYGTEWRRHRKLLNRALNVGTVQRDYSALQEWKTKVYLYNLLQHPEGVIASINRMVGETVTEIAYGASGVDGTDFVAMAEEISVILNDALSGYLVELLPFLKMVPSWFPGAKFKRDAKIWRQRYFYNRNYVFNAVKDRRARHDPLPASFVSRTLDDISADDDRDAEEGSIKSAAFTMYRAGGDSSTATIKFFILAMILHPGIQSKAQAEIDSVVNDRLPGISDRSKLPYTHAIALETIRWGLHGTLGLPHRLTEDDQFNGTFLPSGASVFANLWAMSRDDSIYPEPDKFNPERFYSRNEMDPREFAFGFGRRICPGSHLAMQGFFITVCSFLWAYRVRSRQDLTTVDYSPEALFDFRMASHPLPFECDIEPRSALTEQRLREAMTSGQ